MQLIKDTIQRDILMTSDPMQIVYMNFLSLHIPSQILHAYITASWRKPHLSSLHPDCADLNCSVLKESKDAKNEYNKQWQKSPSALKLLPIFSFSLEKAEGLLAGPRLTIKSRWLG